MFSQGGLFPPLLPLDSLQQPPREKAVIETGREGKNEGIGIKGEKEEKKKEKKSIYFSLVFSSFQSLAVLLASFPTEHFAILEPQYSPIYEFYAV